jgi:hypothetical protein
MNLFFTKLEGLVVALQLASLSHLLFFFCGVHLSFLFFFFFLFFVFIPSFHFLFSFFYIFLEIICSKQYYLQSEILKEIFNDHLIL